MVRKTIWSFSFYWSCNNNFGFVLYESMKDDLKKKEEEVEIKIKDVKNKNIKVIITKTELSDKKEV